MATTGTRNVCSTTNLVAASGNLVGQGSYPDALVRLSYDDASDTDPLWIDVTADVRAFSVSRGRGSELDEVDAGTATLVLNNRARAYDPIITSIRPLSRVFIAEQFTGETQPIYVGYVESVDQQWPAVNDAVAVVSCADEFKVLAMDKLPVTTPPRDTYADVMQFDKPSGYWRMDDPSADAAAAATVGNNLALTGSATLGSPAAIIGDPGTYIALDATSTLSAPVASGESGDPTGLGEFTLEAWIKWGANPAANRDIITGPQANSLSTYVLKLLTTGALQIEARNSAGTNNTVTSPVLTASSFYHVVASITGPGTLTLYINGASVGTSSFSGSFHTSLSATGTFTVGSSATAEVLNFDEIAVYRYGLTATRVSAHYTAGTARGFPHSQQADDRMNATLDAITSQSPRSIGASSREMPGVFMHGQPAVDELRQVARAEVPDGLVFISKAGAVTLLANGHRSSSPYDTVQATFDDDGTDLPYQDLDVDYSESFLFNDVTVSFDDETFSTSDSVSVASFYRRSLVLTDIPLLNLAAHQPLNIAPALLAKYKDPLTRVLSITLLTADPAVTEAAFRLDLGARVRILRTPPGGGARIDQTSFVQSIKVDADSKSPVWRIVLGVSPL